MPTGDYLPLSAMTATAAFRNLNVGQQKFVWHYIENGLASGSYDAIGAVKFAYGQNIKHAAIRARQSLNNKHVAEVLRLHFRRSPLESILSDLRHAAKKSVKLGMGLTPPTVKVWTHSPSMSQRKRQGCR